MGLKCLLGHDFGEREVERDRREEGDEVVVVYRTVENCRRCGTRRVVSENKEVRSIRDAAAAAAGNGETADADDPTTDEEAPTPDAAGDAGDGDGVVTDADADADPPAGSLIEAAEAVGARDGDDAAGPDTTEADADADVEDDDAVILGGTSDANGAGNGADASVADSSPAGAGNGAVDEPGSEADPGGATTGSGAELLGAGEAASNGSGHGAWPTPGEDAEDDGYDATPHDDAETDVDFGGGLAPTDANHAAYVGTDDADDGGDGFVRSERRETDADGPTEFRCPNCGATRSARDSSLRAGDVCPDCRKGYVAERAIEE